MKLNKIFHIDKEQDYSETSEILLWTSKYVEINLELKNTQHKIILIHVM